MGFFDRIFGKKKSTYVPPTPSQQKAQQQLLSDIGVQVKTGPLGPTTGIRVEGGGRGGGGESSGVGKTTTTPSAPSSVSAKEEVVVAQTTPTIIPKGRTTIESQLSSKTVPSILTLRKERGITGRVTEPLKLREEKIEVIRRQQARNLPKTQTATIALPTSTFQVEKPMGIVSAYEEPQGFFESKFTKISEKMRSSETTRARGGTLTSGQMLTNFGLGVASAGLGAAYILIHPIKTGKGIIEKGKQTIQFSMGKAEAPFKEFGSRAITSPEYTSGEFLGTLAVYKAPALLKSGVLKGVDIIRTRGLKELPATDVIAPEYPAQSYPRIKSGQTAGQLLKEFKQPGLTGFTAASKPYAKTTTALRGTSELHGIYQAPKVSPQFLRITGETAKPQLFSFFGDTLRPSVMKIKPESYKLSPLVKSGQKSFVPVSKSIELFGGGELPLKTAKKLFPKNIARVITRGNKKYGIIELPKQILKQGKSYITFVKSEKEAVIPHGTSLQQTAKRYYFKFEGRRVPIFEFETLKSPKGGILKSAKTPKVIDVGSAVRSYSRGLKPHSYFNIYSPLKAGRLSSYRPRQKRRDIIFRGLDYSSREITSSKKPRYYGYGRYSSYFSGLSSYKPKYYGGGYYGGGTGITSYAYPSRIILPRIGGIVSGGSRYKLKVKRKLQIRKPITAYTPSLTGSVIGSVSKKLPKTVFKGEIPLVRPLIK